MIMDLIRFFALKILVASTILISSLVISGKSPPVTAATATDPCSPNPCRNGALCRGGSGGYACFCVPGFQGARCQIDVDECASQPCVNGGTCEDRVGRYTCLCGPGFTGVTCEVQIDECQSRPCLNGGRCHDYTGGFACSCPPGFLGDRCENDIDECLARPCQNGGLCIDAVNGYTCDCSHSAFTGQHCEVPPCQSEPCFNSAPCQDNSGNYTCECWPGFEGPQCEVDISECNSAPCLHGGRCLELSWQALYGSETLLPQRYDPRHAGGYICNCPPGTTGSLCQDISLCEPSPCQNGAVCESGEGRYICHCPSQSQDGVLYGGANCEVKLVGCMGNECHNQATCSPLLHDDTHGYSCSCPPGFTGLLCQTSTTFSFERSGYVLLHSPLVDTEASCSNITLSFRTTQPRAVLLQRGCGDLLLSLELDRGQLFLSRRWEAAMRNETETESRLLGLPQHVSDGEWHTVEAVLGRRSQSLRLLDTSGACESRGCYRGTAVTEPIPGIALAGMESPLFRNTVIGRVQEEPVEPGEGSGAGPGDGSGAGVPRPPGFVGCMRDVLLDGHAVVPEEWPSGSAVHFFPGCRHGDHCLDTPCQNRGRCVSLRRGYRCSCPRPYDGPRCKEEHVPAQFGSEDHLSVAEFSITEDMGHALALSLFLRTQKDAGFLLALANASGQHLLRMWLEQGQVKVQLGDSPETLTGEGVVNDGGVRFVGLEVERGRAELTVDDRKSVLGGLGVICVRAGDRVLVGSLPAQRAAAFGGFFNGCLQDLRINDRRLQFFGLDAPVRTFPLEVRVNVTYGCSGDDICSRKPCLNGVICNSTWDNFSCTCPPRTAGRRCEMVKWCELSPCPTDAECRMISNIGYECYANATFPSGDGSVLTYRGGGGIARNITSISLSLRTRGRHATILHARRGPAFLTVYIWDGLLIAKLRGVVAGEGEKGGEETGEGWEEEGRSTISLSSRVSVSDGEWHSALVSMATPRERASAWTLAVDGEAGSSGGRTGNLNFLRQGVNIHLGGPGRTLAGCLGTVELGGVALPYFSRREVKFPRLQVEWFVRTSPLTPLRTGCRGASSLCRPDPCLNGGQCQALWDESRSCACAPGWAGEICELRDDPCASGPCLHGNCSANGMGYACACPRGYVGGRCQQQVDMCQGHRCAHGATCLHGPDRYACLCAENYTGPYCSKRVEEIPWYIIVRNVRPRLPVSVCGDDVRNYTCFNGGNCSEHELSCDCLPGFTGHWCEQDVDECQSSPCLNGGYCRNLVNKFACVCEMSFAGDVCQTDVSDIYFYVAVLLWQNLCQLLSYLVLRLDDEPEVEWGVDD